MRYGKDVIDAVAKLRSDPMWCCVIEHLKRHRADMVNELLGARSGTEYQRGILAGSAACMDDLLELHETAHAQLETYRTK